MSDTKSTILCQTLLRHVIGTIEVYLCALNTMGYKFRDLIDLGFYSFEVIQQCDSSYVMKAHCVRPIVESINTIIITGTRSVIHNC